MTTKKGNWDNPLVSGFVTLGCILFIPVGMVFFMAHTIVYGRK